MKKIVLSLAVLASVALVSCTKSEKAADTNTVADTNNVEAPAVDTNAKDTTTVQAPAETPAETPAQDTNKPA